MAGNRTWRYLSSTSEKGGYDGDEFAPPGVLADPTFVKRLSHKLSDEDRSCLASNIENVPPEVSFFLDANIWDRDLDPEIWPALWPGRTAFLSFPASVWKFETGLFGTQAISGLAPSSKVART